jgi:membrane-associated phospholipid phosphatase
VRPRAQAVLDAALARRPSPAPERDEGTRRPVLLHEACFALFAAVAWVRFALSLGPTSSDALLYLFFFVAGCVVVAAGPALAGETGAKLRLSVYPAGLAIAYLNLGPALARAGARLWDADLFRLDCWLTGTTPSLVLQRLVLPPLTDALSLCYGLFIPYFATSLVWYFFGALGLARRFFAGLVGLYAIGFLGYLLVPASGPYLAFAKLYTVPLAGGWLTQANAGFVDIGGNKVDAFPSLHCAASAFVLAFDFRHSRGRFWLFLVPVAGLWLSTVYLRYHYLVDLVAGFALAAVALKLTTARSPAIR